MTIGSDDFLRDVVSLGSPDIIVVSLLIAPEHQPYYFQGETKHEKNRADPDVFRRQKHQHATQYKQQNG